MAPSATPTTHPVPEAPPWAPSAPWKASIQLAVGCALLLGLLWGASWAVLRWYGPSLHGVDTVAATDAARADNPAIQEVAALLQAQEIYTFQELIDATDALRAGAGDDDRHRFSMLSMIALGSVGVLLIVRVAAARITGSRRTTAINPLLGIIDPDGRLVHLGAAMCPLRRQPLANVAPLLHGAVPLSPLAAAVLECYAAAPACPASAVPTPSAHGATTLLHHVLWVRAHSLRLAQDYDLPPMLAELAALGHDLGKLAAYRTLSSNGDQTSSIPHHRRSVALLALLPEWQNMTPGDQHDLTTAILFHHEPDRCPPTASPRATRLLALLREADGRATTREAFAQRPAQAPSASAHARPLATHEDNGSSQSTNTGSAPPDSLQTRLTAALTQTVAILRINTRPFDGRTDTRQGLLMLLNRNLRDALTVQLGEDDQRRLALHQASHPSDLTTDGPHPSNAVIGAAFRHLGWLVDEWNGTHGATWNVTLGRRKWHEVWLLRLDQMPATLREKWGQSVWPLTVLGPSGSSSNQPRRADPPAPAPASAPAPPAPRGLANARGRVTPGGLMLLGVAGLTAWFIAQPQEHRVSLACRPIAWLQHWMYVDEKHTDELAARMNTLFAAWTEHCPDTLGAHAARLADQADTAVDQVARAATTQIRSVANRRVERIVSGERVIVEGLGDTRLLGIRVPPSAEPAAVAYLQQTAAGRRVALEVATDLDPERRPLITLRTDTGELLNATLVRRGLARPWKRTGPWLLWDRAEVPTS